MSAAWEEVVPPGTPVAEPVEPASPEDEFGLRFGLVLAEAMLRRAETALEEQRAEGKRIRALLARRKVECRRREIAHARETGEWIDRSFTARLERRLRLGLASLRLRLSARVAARAAHRRALRAQHELARRTETGERVVTYLRVGARNLGRGRDPRQSLLRRARPA